MRGCCECGAVAYEITGPLRPVVGCHCSQCRKTSGHYVAATQAATDDFRLTCDDGLKWYRSSNTARRGFCGTCGSTLWYGTVEDGVRHPSAGLFADAAGAKMTIEFFADACPHGYALAGDHRKMTTQETEALFAPDEEALQ